jgi:Flp pilus assembly protein TadD
LNPDDAEDAALLGILLDMDGRAAEAMSYIEKATQLDPNSANVHELLGNQLAKNGEHLRAVDSLQRATNIEPNAHRYDLLGASLAELERWPEAEAAFESGLKLAPSDHQRMINLAIVRHRLGKIDEAIGLCKSAIAIQEVADTLGLLGQLYACVGRLTEAEVATGRSLELAPDDPRLLANHGSVLAALGRISEAVSCLERSLSADPDNTTIQQKLAELMKNTSRDGEA